MIERLRPFALLLVALLAAGGPSRAQEEEAAYPVTLAKLVLPAEAPVGERFEAKLTVEIASPWHIYGLAAVTGESPTTVKIGKVSGGKVKLAGEPKPDRPAERHSDEYMKYDFWEREVTFTIPLEVEAGDPGAELEIEIVLNHQTCTEEECLPPQDLGKAAKLKVKAGGAAPKPAPGPGFGPGAATGFGNKPVTVRSAKPTGPVGADGKAIVRVEIALAEGYHIYGLAKVGSELPTTFRLKEGAPKVFLAGLPMADRAPKRHQEGTAVYDAFYDRVTFDIPLELSGVAAGEKVPAVLEFGYQACTESSCDLPATESLKIELVAEAAVVARGAPPAAGPGTSNVDRALAGAALAARFEGDRVQPGKPAVLLVELPAGLLAEGSTVPKADLLLPEDVLPAGDALVLAGGTLRVPVEIDKESLADGMRDFAGTLTVGNATHGFGGRVEFFVPMIGFLLLAAGSALFALLTPCVFPMIPITVSFFTKQGEKSHRSPITFGTVYALGIILSFTALGVVFTLVLGAAGAATFAGHAITQGVIGVLFILFALSLFGAFELQLPSALTNLAGGAQGKGGLLGVWLLGLLFAVTTFTCTAPFVGGLLASAAATGQWLRPVVGMLVFSGVLALPFFFLAAFPARMKALPKSGAWLNQVKVAMGFIELAAAFKFLGGMDMALRLDVFTRLFVLAAWIGTLVVMGIYFLGLFRLPHDTARENTGVASMMIAILAFGVALYLATGLGGEPLHKDLEPYLPKEQEHRTPAGRRALLAEEFGSAGPSARPGTAARRVVEFENDVDKAFAAAKADGVLILLNITGHT